MTPTESVLTDQEVIGLIEQLAGDDFCEDLDCVAAFHADELSEREKVCHDKISRIYRISHSHRRDAICHGIHEAWRAEARAALGSGDPTPAPDAPTP